jgi:hypothetical protein
MANVLRDVVEHVRVEVERGWDRGDEGDDEEQADNEGSPSRGVQLNLPTSMVNES